MTTDDGRAMIDGFAALGIDCCPWKKNGKQGFLLLMGRQHDADGRAIEFTGINIQTPGGKRCVEGNPFLWRAADAAHLLESMQAVIGESSNA